MVVLLAGSAWFGGVAWIVANRIAYPGPLEVMEEGIAGEAMRVAAGLPRYVEPTADYAPYLYGPVFPWLGGALFAWFGPSLALLRLVSVVALAWALAELFVLGRRSGGCLAGALAAILFLATYHHSGQWFDLARLDMLHVAVLLASCRVLLHGGWLPAAILLGLAAVFVKQSGVLILTAVAGATALATPRRGVGFGLGVLGTTAVLSAVAHFVSDGWSTFFLWSLPAQHAMLWSLLPEVLFDKLLVELGGYVGLGVAGLIVSWHTLGWRAALPLWGFAAAALAVSCWARLRDGGWYNVMIPGHAALAWAAATGCVALLRQGRPILRWAALGLLVAQLAWSWHDPRTAVPSRPQRANADRVRAVLAAFDGAVLAPSKPLLLVQSGRQPGADGTALWDLDRSNERALAARIEQQIRDRLAAGVYRCLLLADPSPLTPSYPVVVSAFAGDDHAHTALPSHDARGLPVPGYERLFWHLRADDTELLAIIERELRR